MRRSTKRRTRVSRPPRGARLHAALEFLAEGAWTAADLARAILSLPYGASYGQMERKRIEFSEERERAREEEREHRRYWNTLSHLKRAGLVAVREGSRGQTLALTELGIKRLAKLRESPWVSHPPERYRASKSARVLIVAFDVPERYRAKRDWLRGALGHLDLAMVQQSVWVGKVTLPEEFLDDLQVLGLTPHVQMFSVTERGTLRNLVG